MNRIYRIIRKAFSGEAVVVSELAMSRGKSHACIQAYVDKSGNRLRGIGFGTGVALLLSVCCTSAFAQQQVYDNSSAGMLESASGVGSGLPDWTGVFSADQGLVYRSANSTVETGADLLIDYSTAPVPKFVIGGYSGDNNAEVKQNTVTLRQGSVDGPVSGGLSQQTNRLADVNKSGNPVANDNSALSQMTLFNLGNQSSLNAVNIGNGVTVTGDVNASNAVIWLQSGTIRAGNAQTTSNVDIKANTNSTVWAGSLQTIANDNVLSAGNNVSLTGNIAGGSAILHLQAGNATSGNANSTTTRLADAGAESVTLLSDVIQTASDNEVTLGNGSSVTGNINGGSATLFIQAGDTTAGNAVSTSGRTSALANSYASASGTQALTASNNEVTVGDSASVDGSIGGGHVTLLAQAGDARAGDANSPQGTGISASAGAWSNASAPYSKLTASTNVVTVGEGSSVTGDVYGGYTALDAKTGTATAGHADTPMSAGGQNVASADVGIDLNGSVLTASDNKVTVKNGSTVGGDIAGGFAGVRATGGTAIAGYENGNPDSGNSHWQCVKFQRGYPGSKQSHGGKQYGDDRGECTNQQPVREAVRRLS